MNVTGIIAEYNPFHLGHMHQMNYIKEVFDSDYIIVVMSGDYVQRGTPALLPKHVRTEMALRCGADLVLELPVQISSASAEFFARGGVSLLDNLQVVNSLCFGSEEGNTERMLHMARILNQEPEEYKKLLQNFLKQGKSFPAARSQALKEYLCQTASPAKKSASVDSLLSSPNNILGIEYCRAILKLHSSIKPVTLKREGAAYHETSLLSGQNPSASAVRNFLTSGNIPETGHIQPKLSLLSPMLPPPSFALLKEALEKKEFLTEHDLDSILHYCLLSEVSGNFAQYADVSQELSDRIRNQLGSCRSFSQFAELLKTKELTRARIQRALLHILLHIKEAPPGLSWARVLGFKKDSAPLLKEIKKKGNIPLLTKPADAHKVLSPDSLSLLEENTRASNIYESLLCQKSGKTFKHEYQKQILII